MKTIFNFMRSKIRGRDFGMILVGVIIAASFSARAVPVLVEAGIHRAYEQILKGSWFVWTPDKIYFSMGYDKRVLDMEPICRVTLRKDVKAAMDDPRAQNGGARGDDAVKLAYLWWGTPALTDADKLQCMNAGLPLVVDSGNALKTVAYSVEQYLADGTMVQAFYDQLDPAGQKVPVTIDGGRTCLRERGLIKAPNFYVAGDREGHARLVPCKLEPRVGDPQ